jgi:hypothetical protein
MPGLRQLEWFKLDKKNSQRMTSITNKFRSKNEDDCLWSNRLFLLLLSVKPLVRSGWGGITLGSQTRQACQPQVRTPIVERSSISVDNPLHFPRSDRVIMLALRCLFQAGVICKCTVIMQPRRVASSTNCCCCLPLLSLPTTFRCPRPSPLLFALPRFTALRAIFVLPDEDTGNQ